MELLDTNRAIGARIKLKNRLIFESVLNGVRARYEINKKIGSVNKYFSFLDNIKYNDAYFKSVPIDKMLYSTLVRGKVYSKLVNPLIDDINFIDEFIAAMKTSKEHEKLYILLLIGGIKKYIGKVTKEKLFNIYVATIYGFFSEYTLRNVNNLIWIVDKIMNCVYIKEEPIFDIAFATKILNNFSHISPYILLNGIENEDLKINFSKATLATVDDIKIKTVNIQNLNYI